MKMCFQSSHSIRLARRATSGFSLVEVVLAVGIMALGVVTILGLLPHGMEMSRKTANELAETRIIEQLIGEIQTGAWDAVAAAVVLPTRTFDDQGLEIEPGDETSMNVSYVAQAEVAGPDVQLPTNLPAENLNLRRVTVKVASVPIPDFDFANPAPGVPVRAFTQLVVKMR